MTLREGTWRDAEGGIVIRSRMRPGTTRRDLERQIFPGVQVGLPGWERAHSQGAGLGVESPFAIRYAPSKGGTRRTSGSASNGSSANCSPANRRAWELWPTTVTHTHPRTLRLREIQYRIDAVRGAAQQRLFEASIAVADRRLNPRVTVHATPLAAVV